MTRERNSLTVVWKEVEPMEGYQFGVKGKQPFCAQCGRPVAHGRGEEYECRYCERETEAA